MKAIQLNRAAQVTAIVIAVLLIDQILKIWVKTNFYYGEEVFLIGDWARLHFLENEGMAYGARFHDIPFIGKYIDPAVAKPLLTFFRIFAVGFIIYLIKKMIKGGTKKGAIFCMALILAGAIGNIIDSIFYGKLFSESPRYSEAVATMFPEGGGYAGWFYGKVVDMFYFPIIQTTLPEWFPINGGEPFEFFRPVFNFADASISVGIFIILLFHRGIFSDSASA